MKNIVYTYGVFDLLHWGHIELLKEAKKLGDYLIVGIFTDEVATSFKRKPVLSEKTRLKTIESLGLADLVIYQKELNPQSIINKYKIDIVAKGNGAGFEEAEFKNCQKMLLDYHNGISTTEIIKKIQNDYIK
jgi:glycerol-3-phosphate cytidylyltransferase